MGFIIGDTLIPRVSECGRTVNNVRRDDLPCGGYRKVSELGISHQPRSSLVEDGDEGKHGAGAADDGKRLAGESSVHHAAQSRCRDHLKQASDAATRSVNQKRTRDKPPTN